MAIREILHASVIVKDTAKSLAFYNGVLGLPIDPQRPDLGYPGAWLKVSDTQQIHLLELPNPDSMEGRPEHGGRDRHIALGTDQLDGIITKLTAHRLSYTLSRSGRKALFCRDPDGNALELIASE